MSAADEQGSRLRALHEAYVWRVNAAVAAGRPELARALADEYSDEALAVLAGEDGAACEHALYPPDERAHLNWLRRLFTRRRP
jgi:hypothetical protein